MHAAIGIFLLLLVIFGPQLWVSHVLRKYGTPIKDLPGTGGELATHLVNRLQLTDVVVESTKPGSDHYDPDSRTIRLSPDNFDGRSLTAIVVAAHEVGHAMQHQGNYAPLLLRRRLVRVIAVTEKVAALLIVLFPVAALVTRVPAVGVIVFAAGIATLGLPVILHLVTLPVEWDASFRRALPVLVAGQYLPANAIGPARQILAAAALTYVAASLSSLLNFYRWIAILRR